MRDGLFLTGLRRFEDVALLLLRLGTGAFLIYGVWDNVTSAARMAEFAGFLRQFGFPAPTLMAPLSVYAQFLGGLLLILGALTRWNGLVQALQFTIAILMVDRLSPQGLRGVWPAGALVLISLYLATHGAGRFSIDAIFEPRRR